MPPVRIEVIVARTSEVKRLPDAQPNSLPVPVEDGGETIVVTCNRGDDGGVAARYGKAEVAGLMVTGGQDNSKLIAEIGDGQAHSMEISSKYGEATLRLTHYRDDADDTVDLGKYRT